MHDAHTRRIDPHCMPPRPLGCVGLLYQRHQVLCSLLVICAGGWMQGGGCWLMSCLVAGCADMPQLLPPCLVCGHGAVQGFGNPEATQGSWCLCTRVLGVCLACWGVEASAKYAACRSQDAPQDAVHTGDTMPHVCCVPDHAGNCGRRTHMLACVFLC